MEHRPKRSLGQNFLRDETIVSRIIGSLWLTPGDTVLEIGPGLGALTQHLVKEAKKVIALEFDRDMVTELARKFADASNLSIINTDALSVDLDDLLKPEAPVKVAANLPYNISTAILQRLIAARENFISLVLMFQKEVVDRILARPSTGERGFLTVLVENAFHVERLFDVPPQAFYPAPKVQSSVVRLVPRPVSIDEVVLEQLASAAFRQRRKTLHNNLKDTDFAHLPSAAGVDPGRRAETLTNEEWRALVQASNKK